MTPHSNDPGRSWDRHRSMLALGMTAALVISACSGAAPTASPAVATAAPTAAANTATPAQATSTAAASTAPASPQLTGNITYWHHFTSDNEMKGLEQAQKSFETANPGVKLTTETVPNPDYMAKITTAVQANQRPDTAMVAVDRLPDMVKLGAILPLTDRVKAWKGYSDFSQQVWDGATLNGQIYGVPAFSFVDVLFYRVDWFKAAGVNPPGTWEEFEKAAVAMTDPAKHRYGFALRAGPGGAGWFMKVMESFGAKFVDAGGKPVLDRATVVKALDYYTGLSTKDHAVPPSAAQDGYTQTVTGFTSGQTAMLFQSTGALTDLISGGLKPGVDFATAPMPSGTGGSSGRVSSLYNGMSSDKNADASWAWLTQWGDLNTQLDFMKATGYFPPSKAAQQDPFIQNDPIMGPAVKAYTAGVPDTQFVGLPAFQSDTLLPALQQVLTGQKTVDAAADDIVAGLKKATGN